MKAIAKHSMSCIPDTVIETEIDADRRVVTLQLDDFDSHHVATFVTRVLPEQGVVAFRDDAAVERVGRPTPPAPFQLAIFLSDREYVAQVVRLADGQVTVWLENPSKTRKRRLDAAAARALQLLHEAGWEAIGIDDVAAGFITPDSMAEVRIDDREREISRDDFGKLWELIEAETSGYAVVERASTYVPGTFEDMLRMPHLAWDSEFGSVVQYRHDFVSDAAYRAAWKRVHKAADERFDVRGSSLVALVNICFDHRGSIPEEWHARLADQVQEEAFDFLEHVVRREREAPGAVQRRARDRQGKLDFSADSDTPAADVGALRSGTVSRLNQGVGFGYVNDDDGMHCYIFVFGNAIKYSDARQLCVGARVRFRLEEGGRVSELQPA